ncbi:MAG: ester cyclase [Ktedonobacteraceae bacterium]
MSTEDNKALVRRFYEQVINQKNLTLVDELCTTTHVYHNPPTTLHGREEFKQLLSLYTTAFPDARLSVENQLAEGDQVVIRYTFRGTHQADLIGIPPTGKQVTVTGMIITRIVNGTFEEGWLNFDALGMLQQLGVIPTMG